jgi:uncharacterized protein YyaL (SSP411 family)
MLMHTWRDGKADVPAFLSDHSLLCEALLDLYESTFDLSYLRRARELATIMVEDYWDQEAGLFSEAGTRNEQLVAPLRTAADQPVPSGNSVACHALLRLAALGGADRYLEVARRLLEGSLALMQQSPLGTGHMLSAALRYLSEPREFVIVGLDGRQAEALLATVDKFYLPHMVRMGVRLQEAAELCGEMPLLGGKEAIEGRPTAYLCSGGTCRRPVQEPSELRRQLESLVPERP